jgi:hypothetical protein
MVTKQEYKKLVRSGNNGVSILTKLSHCCFFVILLMLKNQSIINSCHRIETDPKNSFYEQGDSPG